MKLSIVSFTMSQLDTLLFSDEVIRKENAVHNISGFSLCKPAFNQYNSPTRMLTDRKFLNGSLNLI